MDKLIHGPSSTQPPQSEATTKSGGSAAYHPMHEANVLQDFKALLTKPRYFFEFFAHPEKINHVVWAKIILVFLGLSALNSMISFSSPSSWYTSIEGLDPRLQHFTHEFFQRFGTMISQAMSAIIPFFTLISTVASAAFCLLALRLLGGDPRRLTWTGVFCVMIAAQWTTVFGFIPGVGGALIGLLPLVFAVIGLSQVAKLSKLRTFVGAFILPALLTAITMGLLFGALAMFAMLLF